MMALFYSIIALLSLPLISSQAPDFDYSTCGSEKGCFGYTDGCVASQDCDLVFSVKGLDANTYEFQLAGPYSDSSQYVALGLNKAGSQMVKGVALVCHEVENDRQVNMYDMDGKSGSDVTLVKEDNPDFGVSGTRINVIDGYISCTFQTSNYLNFTSPDDDSSDLDVKQIDLSREPIYQLLAYGPQASTGYNLAHHLGRKVSTERFFAGLYNPETPTELLPFLGCNPPDYQGKKCIAEDPVCLEELNCETLLTYEGVSEGLYRFELQYIADVKTGIDWIGAALSDDSSLGEDSVILCEVGGRVRSFMTVDDGSGETLPVVLDDPNYGISGATYTSGDNFFYCSFNRTANMSISTPSSIDPSITQPITKDFYMNVESYQTGLVTGTNGMGGEPDTITVVNGTDQLVDFTKANRFFDPRYEGCFETVGCFGLPFGCVEDRTCQVLLTYRQTDFTCGITEFELSGFIGEDGYLAMGLSQDTIMGSDLVFVCSTYDTSTPYVYKAWNSPDEQFNYPSIGLLQDGILANETSWVDGIANCHFVANTTVTVRGKTCDEAKFDLTRSYHILLATGGMTNELSTSLHTDKLASGNMVNFNDPDQVITEVTPSLVKAHAACMVVAWFFAASSGIFVAMYMKKQFGNLKILGRDAWFPLHQLLMVLTWILGISGFVTIVAQYEFRPLQLARIKTNPHALIGLLSITLMFIQPFLAVLRCGAHHKLRPVFNAIHFFVGFVAMCLSMTAVYFTTLKSFPSAIMAKEVEYITYAYFGLFGVLHLCMMIYSGLKWNTREANDKIVAVFAAVYFLANFSITVALLVYIMDSQFLIFTVIEKLS